QPTTFPYVIDVDMNGLYPVNTVTYLPRANLGNGVIKGYKIEAARFPGQFKTVAEGEFEKFTKVESRAITFDATWARYLRISFTSAQNGSHFGSAAEIDVLQDLDAEPLPDETEDIGTETLTVDGVDYEACRKDTVGADWTLDLDGTWDKIKGHAGMESGNANTGTVTFRILADGKEIFSRVGMKPQDVKQLIDVDIPVGAKQLRFTLTGEVGASASDTGVWTELRLFRAGSGIR
ncbi:MAG TPA: NPCBM/NEW2 domain-containing protein, partial [Candidatus Spyradenecus faecavium]|nr:NPCBM/NEW2 domain-containing protein [Candidatus Spyradenecus faecavium]